MYIKNTAGIEPFKAAFQRGRSQLKRENMEFTKLRTLTAMRTTQNNDIMG